MQAMNDKTFRIVLLGVLCAASTALPPANAADTSATTKRINHAIADVKRMHANQAGLAAQQAKIAVDALKRQVNQVEYKLKHEPSERDRNDRDNLLVTLKKLHKQRDQLVHSYKKLDKISDAEWSTAKKTFLKDYNRLHDTLSEAQKAK